MPSFIEPVSDANEVVALLTACGLPVSDILPTQPIEFFGMRSESSLSAVVGLELSGSAGLLRSLAVAPSCRGQGLGRELVAYAERYAASRGVEVLYLLTTTAPAFFERRGYAPTSRAAVPPAIRTSSEFSRLCPASSVCLSKSLATSAPDPTPSA